MAAQVLSGSGNLSFTNSTGQNVRLVINYLELDNVGGDTTVSFPGNAITLSANMIYGKTLAYKTAGQGTDFVASMAGGTATGSGNITPLPLEIALANGDTFSITGNTSANIKGYNCIIIPEAG